MISWSVVSVACYHMALVLAICAFRDISLCVSFLILCLLLCIVKCLSYWLLELCKDLNE